ncbi:alpha-D-ribose 1-methylphosphonate 5-triphosphate diphosphatase [Acidimangrovimonas sediminis]|uniref:alpha-D-ribose 1-methylphosphonate 5-triphosphate diphosphatase n=1 Tax=Acidimangrovimonas sediminis TaxID=2056283 RepID=UPI000C7FC35A|nr:alpha-D-ribose 1-methylphosphonate 5-triphosphate diphosphatase [Acidimangrovimonas sediminis]
MSDLVLTNARIVTGTAVIRGSLRVAGGCIAAIDDGPVAVPGARDCGGDLLIPGLVELHTDNLERHLLPRPGVAWPQAAAILAHDGELASAGITTVFDALRVGSIVSNGRVGYGRYARSLADALGAAQAEGMLRIGHFLHLRAEVCSETLIEELAGFGPEDRVGILSLMDHTPGQRQFRDLGQLRAYVMGKHGMTEAEFERHVETQKATRARLGTAHEAAAVAAARRLGAVLASHDDTTAAQVATSAGHGVRLAEFPTTEEAALACRGHGIAVMMGAPNLIRGGSHSGNVAAEELAAAGLLDILSSDYVPGALLLAALRLATLWDDLPRAVARVTSAPASAAGLDDRGRLAPGLRADMVQVARIGEQPVIRGVWSRGRQVG